MGGICSPRVANLYLYIIEIKWSGLYSCILYNRFIDDIFILSKNKINKSELDNHFGYLKLNIVEDESVNFLDLNISFDKITKTLNFNLYTKPTNSHNYLLSTSNHPKHIFLNIPKSQFIRIRRICSCDNDYYLKGSNLAIDLIKRGYDHKNVLNQFNIVYKMKREDLIPYKSKNNMLNIQKDIIILNKFNINFGFLKSLFTDSFYKMKKEIKLNYLNKMNLRNIYSVNTNIGSLLIHNFKYENLYNFDDKKFYNNKCLHDNCNICNFMINSYKLDIYSKYKIEKIIFPCLSNSDCNSIGVVYIICCNKCNVYYIGESGRNASTRIKEHMRNINNFGRNIEKSILNFDKTSEVAVHFNTMKHEQSHFKFFIFRNNLIESEHRKSIETDLINMFINLGINILNKPNKIPSIKYIKNLAFC
jgi:hypothetical protein